MSQSRLFVTAVAGALLALAPFVGVANAQTVTAAVTCPGGGPRALTHAENSMVNDYEILLAKANSKHTSLPDLSPDVAALIACTSGGGTAPTTATPAAPSSSSSTSSAPSTSAAMSGCAVAAGPLTKAQNSTVNDYEILLAKANSQHTPVPAIPPDVAALIGC